MSFTGGKIFELTGARLVFKNFAGKETKYTPEGARNFCVIVPPDIAAEMREAGWKLRHIDGDPGFDYCAVWLSAGWPEDIKQMDADRITHADIVIEGCRWEINGKKGVKVYLHSINGRTNNQRR